VRGVCRELDSEHGGEGSQESKGQIMRRVCGELFWCPLGVMSRAGYARITLGLRATPHDSPYTLRSHTVISRQYSSEYK